MAIGRQVAEAYIDVNGDTTSFRRSLNKLGDALKKQQKQLDAQAKEMAKARAKALGQEDDNYTSKMKRVFKRAFNTIEKDHKGMVGGMSSAMNRLGRINSNVLGKMQKSWARMDGTVRLVLMLIAAGADQMATLGSGLGASMVAMVSSIGMALANIIPLMATIPALGLGIGLMVSAIGRIKKAGGEAAKALKSVGDAYKNTLVPAFTTEVEGAVGNFAKNLAKILDDAELGKALGKAFSGITQSFADMLVSPGMTAFMAAMKNELPRAVEGFGRGFAKTFEGMFSLMAGAAPAAEKIGKAFQNWGTEFSVSMETMRKDGTLERVFDTAYKSGAALMRLTGSISRALGVLFMTGAKHGDELLNSLSDVTDQFTAYMKTAQGQKDLNQWFANGTRIIKAMEPLLVGAGKGMALLVNEASIKRWERLNVNLGEFVYNISDVLRVIGQIDILGALALLLNGLSQALRAMGDPLENLAISLGKTLWAAVEQINRVLIHLGTVLGELIGKLEPVIHVLEKFFIAALTALADAAIWVIDVLATLLGPALEALSSIAESAAPWFARLGEVIGVAFEGLRNTVGPIAETVGKAMGALVYAFGALYAALAPVVEVLVGALAYGLSFLGGAVESLSGSLSGGVATALGGFAGLIESITPAISTFAAMIASGLGSALEGFVSILAGLMESTSSLMPSLTSFGDLFLSIFGRIGEFVAPIFSVIVDQVSLLANTLTTKLIPALGPALFGAFGGILTALGPMMPVLGNLIATLVSLAGSIIATVLPAISPLVSLIGGVLISAFTTLAPILTNMVTRFTDIASVIIGQLLPAFGPAFTGLLDSLQRVLSGSLIPAIGGLIAMVTDLALTFVEELLPAIMPIVTEIMAKLGPALESLGQVLGVIIGAITEVVGVVLGALLPALQPLITVLLEVIGSILTGLVPAFKFIGEVISNVMPLVLAIVKTVIDQVVGIIQGIVKVIEGVVKIVRGIFTGDWEMIWSGVKDVIFGAVEAIFNFLMLWIGGKIVGIFKIFAGPITKIFGGLFKGLINLVKTPITTIVNFLKGAIGGIAKLFGNGGGIMGAWSALWRGFTAPFQTAWAGFLRMMVPFRNFVDEAMQGIAKTVSTLGVVFKKVWDGIIGVLKFVGTTFASIFQGIGGLISGIGRTIAGIGGAIGKFFSGLIGDVQVWVLQLVTKFGGIGGNLIQGLIKGIVGGVALVLGAMTTLGQNILTGIKAFFGIHSPSTVFAEIGTFLIQGLVNGVLAMVETVLSVFRDLGQWIMDAIKNAFDLVTGIISVATSAWNSAIDVALTAIRIVFNTVLNAIKSVVSTVFAAVSAVIKTALAVWKEIISTTWNVIKTVWTTVIDSIKTAVNTVFLAIGTIIRGVIDTIKIVVNAGLKFIKAIFSGDLDGAKRIAVDAFNAIRSKVDETIGRLKSIISGGLNTIKSNFSNAWNTVRDGVSTAFWRIANSVSEGISRAVNYVRELPGKASAALSGLGTRLYSSGSDMLNGFINGIRSVAHNITNAALDAVGNAVNAVKNFLGIRSPSRLFMTLGGYTGQGFANGMEAMKSTVARAGENMASMATEAFGKSKMFIAGQDAAYGLADGLSASKNVIKGAIGALGGEMTVSAKQVGALGSSATGSSRDESVTAPGGVTIAPGAIQVITPTESPRLVAIEVLDELTRFSSL